MQCSHHIVNSAVTNHYSDVIMNAMASQIASLTIVYSTVYSGVDQRKHQISASLTLVRGIHRSPRNSPHKGPVTRKMLPFDDVIMVQWNLVNLVMVVLTGLVILVLSIGFSLLDLLTLLVFLVFLVLGGACIPDSKVHGANMGPIWGLKNPGGPHVGPMNFAIWDMICHNDRTLVPTPERKPSLRRYCHPI